MKFKIKFISIFTLFLIMGNFFIESVAPIVNALESNLVENEVTSNISNIATLKENIDELKQDLLYTTSNAYFSIINYMEQEVLLLDNELQENKAILDNGILLKDLINNCFIDKKDIYDMFFIDDDTTIDILDIVDIKYLTEEQEEILLTKSEIENALYNYYLKDIDIKITYYYNNFDSIKENYFNNYNNVITIKDNYAADLVEKTEQIESFYEEEILNYNVPNMDVDDINIIDYLISCVTNLNNEVINYSYEEINIKIANISNIYNKALEKINIFYLQNRNYLENGLVDEIKSLEDIYNNINIKLSSLIDLEEYKNLNEDNLSFVISSSLIDVLNEICETEDVYEKLQNEIDIYLNRKPSDLENINELMLNINNLREYLNKNKVLKLIRIVIDNNEFTEDLIDNLLEFNYLTLENKQLLQSEKLKYYPLVLKDETNYTMEIKDSYIVLNNVVDVIEKDLFISNLDYLYHFEVYATDNITSDTKVILYDKNNLLLASYNIIIKGDIDNDNIVTINDVDLFIDKLLNDNLIDLIRFDYNDDNIIDINDVILMKKGLEEENNLSDGKKSNFEIVKKISDGIICYEVKIVTDGVVNGFSFDFNVSDNLLFDSIKNNGLNININKDKTKIIGIGSFKNNDSFTICFKEITSNDNANVFSVNNLKFVYDNLNRYEIDNIKLVTINELVESNTVAKKNNVVYLNNDDEIASEEEAEEIKEIKEEEKEKEQEENIKEDKKTTDNVAFINVVKIIVIVLLGAVIVYFLNKNDDEEIFNDKDEIK